MPRTRSTTRIQSRRRGSMFIEVAVGVGVALVVMVAVAQLVAVISHQRINTAQIRLATREAANAMEHLQAAPWNELNPAAPPEVTISTAAAERLDDPRLSVVITESQAEVRVKQIEVRIDWLNRAGQRGAPFRLVAWRHSDTQADGDIPTDDDTLTETESNE